MSEYRSGSKPTPPHLAFINDKPATSSGIDSASTQSKEGGSLTKRISRRLSRSFSKGELPADEKDKKDGGKAADSGKSSSNVTTSEDSKSEKDKGSSLARLRRKSMSLITRPHDGTSGDTNTTDSSSVRCSHNYPHLTSIETRQERSIRK